MIIFHISELQLFSSDINIPDNRTFSRSIEGGETVEWKGVKRDRWGGGGGGMCYLIVMMKGKDGVGGSKSRWEHLLCNLRARVAEGDAWWAGGGWDWEQSHRGNSLNREWEGKGDDSSDRWRATIGGPSPTSGLQLSGSSCSIMDIGQWREEGTFFASRVLNELARLES